MGTGTAWPAASSPTGPIRSRSCCRGQAISRHSPARSRPSTRSARATRSSPGWSTAGSSGSSPKPLIRHALACAVANALVWDAGAIDPAEVARWAEEIQVETTPPDRVELTPGGEASGNRGCRVAGRAVLFHDRDSVRGPILPADRVANVRSLLTRRCDQSLATFLDGSLISPRASSRTSAARSPLASL